MPGAISGTPQKGIYGADGAKVEVQTDGSVEIIAAGGQPVVTTEDQLRTDGPLVMPSSSAQPLSEPGEGAIHFLGTKFVVSENGGAYEDLVGGAAGVGGSTGATDNRVLRSDGTGGATVQNSDVSIADAGGGIVQMSVAGNAFDIGTTSGNNVRFIRNGTAVVTVGANGLLDATGAGGTFSINVTTPTGAIYAFTAELDSGFGRAAANSPAIYSGGTEVGRFDNNATATNTRFLLYDVDSGTLKRVSVGAADSGGTGFKVLRIPN